MGYVDMYWAEMQDAAAESEPFLKFKGEITEEQMDKFKEIWDASMVNRQPLKVILDLEKDLDMLKKLRKKYGYKAELRNSWKPIFKHVCRCHKNRNHYFWTDDLHANWCGTC